ncbi:MAG: J domain-containing protein [Rhodothermales bacterium]
MSEKKDYYKILGVHERAAPEEIKKMYRQLAREYHPDRNQGRSDAEERFKAVQEAYDILSDPRKRRMYDHQRREPIESFEAPNGDSFYRQADGSYVRRERRRPAQPPQESQPYTNGARPSGGVSGFFSRLFGGGEEEAPPGDKRGKLDLDTRLRLSFTQALKGGKTEVTLPHGETVRIKIPRGVQSGFKIRLKERGRVGSTAIGDLYVTFEVEPHHFFRRIGDDLHIICTINPIEAMLGITRNMVNAYGSQIKLKIPPGAQPGSKLRLKGQGVKTEQETGDMYVQIDIRVPENLSVQEREILREAARKVNLI